MTYYTNINYGIHLKIISRKWVNNARLITNSYEAFTSLQ